MKQRNIKPLLYFLIFALIVTHYGYSQDNCKVLLDSISGTYKGDCKKGLADGSGTATGTDTYTGEFKKGLPHGTGKYTWANGNFYEGQFKNGLKSGKGAMTVILPDGKRNVMDGYWDNNAYLGEYQNPYKVLYRSPDVLSVRITETTNPDNDGQALFVQILNKGKSVQNPDFSLNETSGSYTSKFPVGVVTKVIVSKFPFGFSIGYMGETAEIIIYKAGSWSINLDYNK
jgi:hypothetical protein